MAAKPPAKQPGSAIVVTTTVQLIGVSLLTLLAGTSDQMGKVVILVMVGFLLGWLLLNTPTLQGWIKKA